MHFDASRFFHFPCSCKTLWVESLLGSFVTGSVRPCHKYPNSPSDVALWSLSLDFPNNCKKWQFKKYWEERGRRRYLGYFSDWLIAGKVWHRIWPWIPTPCDANKTNQKQNRPIATAAQSEINRKNCAISIIHKRRRPKRGFGREIHWPLSRIMGLSMSKEGGDPKRATKKGNANFSLATKCEGIGVNGMGGWRESHSYIP